MSGAGNLLGEASTALDWGIKTDNEVNMESVRNFYAIMQRPWQG